MLEGFHLTRSFASIVMLTVVVLSLSGCRPTEKPPTTYKVTGKVVYSDDDSPMTSGLIEFRSTTDPTLTTKGMIQSDGTFEAIR